jgi:hypothetical protein
MKKIKHFIIQILKKLGFQIIEVRGFVRQEGYDVDGSLLFDTGFEQNVITNTALAAISALIGNVVAVPAATYLAVGTDATAASASQTALIAELTTLGFARSVADTVQRVTTTQTNDTLQLIKTWTSTGSTTINEAGVFNASSSGTMFARKVTGAKSFTIGQSYVLTYNIQIA